MRKALLYVGATCLVLLLGLVVAAEYFSHRDRRFTGQVVDALPRNIAGWTRRDIPVADSKAGNMNVQGILNFSQSAQALYVRGETSILVYAAYWEPGKVSVVDAGSIILIPVGLTTAVFAPSVNTRSRLRSAVGPYCLMSMASISFPQAAGRTWLSGIS